MTTLTDALAAYRICAEAEGKSPRTVQWIMSSVAYFEDYLGYDPDVSTITADDLRGFIIALRKRPKFLNHPNNKTEEQRISAISIQTYARAIRTFFSSLCHEGLIDQNPMERVKLPKAPKKVVPTFNEREIIRLLSKPDKTMDVGFRDYALLLTFVDTGARLSEIVELTMEDVDLENGYLRVMGKGDRERYIPFGQKVAKALLKYKLKHRPAPLATDRFWLTNDGRPLKAGRTTKIVRYYGRVAGLNRCYPHKLRHTSSVIYLRNGGDPFSLQKKLGHSSLLMTRHYANLADSDVKRQHLRYGVVDRLKV